MLYKTFSLAAALFAAAAVASPLAASYSVHETRDALPPGWERRELLDRRALLPMRIGLTQGNLHNGHEWLMEVSHPESEKFGQHWTPQQVAEAFAPSAETVQTVRTWLENAGIAADRVKQSASKSWLEFEAPVEEVEELLKTQYYVYEHSGSAKHVACEEYSVPANVQQHIDLILPTVHFDAHIEDKVKREVEEEASVRGIGSPNSPSLPKPGPQGPYFRPKGPFAELAKCNATIFPDCLRALYEFPPGITANPRNSYGIVEYTPQAYVPSDLDLFFRNFSSKQIGERPTLDSIDGGVVQQQNMSFKYNGESDLDLEYAMTLIYPQKVTLYQVGDLVEGATFNNFLDGIDKSYCTYEGGDSPVDDATYPDPLPGGYPGQSCGTFAPTRVISTSYGFNEADVGPFYVERQCREYMKLGLQGVSVLYSSGDYGVGGQGGQCIAANGSYNDGSSGTFNPSFPATCPYVTSVGATQVKPNVNIVTALATGTQPETACESVIYSGGGFSNVFPLPSYQRSAVKNWFARHPPPYTAAQFNNSQQTRGYPDISANGANYIIAIDGEFGLVFGTSASSPVLGSILTLINEARFDIGKGSIGFINPTAYANPWMINDITTGNNPGCGTNGFSAAAGWDPVTGLGTPNFPKMLAYWLALP